MYTTTYVISFEGWRVPIGYQSDGCTCAPDKVLGINISECCIWHDWARHHLVHYKRMTPQEADAHFRRFLKKKGAPSWVATIYWVAVKLFRRRFNKTYPIPSNRENWLRYINRVT